MIKQACTHRAIIMYAASYVPTSIILLVSDISNRNTSAATSPLITGAIIVAVILILITSIVLLCCGLIYLRFSYRKKYDINESKHHNI